MSKINRETNVVLFPKDPGYRFREWMRVIKEHSCDHEKSKVIKLPKLASRNPVILMECTCGKSYELSYQDFINAYDRGDCEAKTTARYLEFCFTSQLGLNFFENLINEKIKKEGK